METATPHCARCFFSMAYGHELIDWVYKVARTTGASHGLDVIRADQPPEHTAWTEFVPKVQRMIDDALVVAVEASGYSWFVAFELFYAMHRKPCLVLVAKAGQTLPGVRLDRGVQSALPGRDVIEYGFPLPDTEREQDLRERLEAALTDALRQCDRWRMAVTGRTFHASGRQVPPDPIEPTLARGRRPPELVQASELFAEWARTGKSPRRIVITGGQGTGKTVLLSRFTKWLAGTQTPGEPQAATLPPVGVFMTAADVPEALTRDSVECTIAGLAEPPGAPSPQGVFAPAPPESFQLLRPYCHAGRAFVLLDGVDEIGTRRPGEVVGLLRVIEGAFGGTLNIVLTCRRNYWEHRLQAANKDFERFDIQDFTSDEAEALLARSRIALPPVARDPVTSELRAWLLNPLSVGFITSIHNTPHWEGAFASRTKLYEAWARCRIDAESRAMGVPCEDLQTLLRTVALRLLEQRESALPFSSLAREMSACLNRPLTMEQLIATDILAPVGGEGSGEGQGRLRFCHESVYEFFVSWALERDFRKVVTEENTTRAELDVLGLSRVSLDYLQASTYGFISEFMVAGTPGFLPGLKRRLAACARCGRPDRLTVPEKLLRNLVECAGMVYRGGTEKEDREWAELLVQIAGNRALGTLVRFNAARAVERIHPQAPRPYFDYVSDWRGRDWSSENTARLRQRVAPFVMLGATMKVAAPGRHYYFTPKPDLIQRDNRLQEILSRELGALLKRLLDEAPSAKGRQPGPDRPQPDDESPVRVNCTNAWVRWYHPQDSGLVARLRTTAERKGLRLEAHNLRMIEALPTPR